MKRGRSVTYGSNITYFLTTTVTGFAKLFHLPKLAEILVQNINFYRQKFQVKIHGYIIMSNHIQLLVTMGEKGNISRFMGQLKKYSAKQILAWCEQHEKQDLLKIFSKSAQKYKPTHRYQVWQERFDDVVIYSEEIFDIKLNYIHQNPLQEHWQLAGNPEEYALSSASHYILGMENIIPITLADQE